MTTNEISAEIRVEDFFSHIDMGFLNRRLAISALGPLRDYFLEQQRPGKDQMTVLRNDHLLVTMLIDLCTKYDVPNLIRAMNFGKQRSMFMSSERLMACPEIYDVDRVKQRVYFDIEVSKPCFIKYHVEHIVSATGKMTLAEGYTAGYLEALIGLLHDRGDFWEIEPIVIGAPSLEHSRNSNDNAALGWASEYYGEILAEDIDQFSCLEEVKVKNAEQWMAVMQKTPEVKVKNAFAEILKEPTKKDWGGEENDHLSANIIVGGRRRTAAFLLKGPSKFQEMTPAMCGKNGDQIVRLTNSGADISIVQHSHLIGSAVRATLRSLVVTSGRHRKFCLIDGHATYRILKVYGFV